jgi:photosystem II stability/assembly factor-like uncharacterized protein
MCSRLMHTTTGGRRWTVLARPALPGPGVALDEGLIDMFFVDAHTGYVFAADECRIGCVIVTHDGGRSWQASTVPPLLQVLAGARFVYGLANSSPRPTVLRATIGTDRWTTVPIPTRALPPRTEPGARPLPFIAVEGDTIAVLRRSPAGTSSRPAQLGALWVSADRGDHWSQRPNPCSTRDGGAALMSIARGHPAAFLLDCFDNKQSQQAQATQHHLYGSADAGRHWTRLTDPARGGIPVLMTDNGNGHAFLATESGGGDTVTATLDFAAHWRSAVTSGGSFYGWADLRFVNATTGFLLGPTHYAPEHLYRTDDAGRSWRIVPVHGPR